MLSYELFLGYGLEQLITGLGVTLTMAFIGRKQPATTPTQTQERPGRPRLASGGSGSGGSRVPATADKGRFGKVRGNVRDIAAELRKVTWPTREETRNLTLVVIGITAVLGTILGSLDFLLSYLYRLVNP